jgi:hypothetical protein
MSEARQIVAFLLETDEVDPKAFITANHLYPIPKIKTSFSRITWHDNADGDPDAYDEEHGFEDEEGEEFEIDEFDRDDGIDLATKVAKWLRNKGVIEGSSSHFHPGIWYTSEGDINYRTGAETQRSFHLEGFTPEEEEAIFYQVFPRRATPPRVFPNQPPPQ